VRGEGTFNAHQHDVRVLVPVPFKYESFSRPNPRLRLENGSSEGSSGAFTGT
jgi:hypothetical protein